jgi:hypothetical protein
VARQDWLLLIHQIPARPLYLRARVRTLLERAGAVALKNSVYAMPQREGALDRLQAVAAEVRERGGEAFVCEARFDASDEKRLIEASRRVRDQDYADVRKAAGERAVGASRAQRLERRLEWIASVDFFDAGGRREATAAVQRMKRGATRAARGASERAGAWVHRTWATRSGVHVDRIACAWYVRRFLDPGARFRFVASGGTLRSGDVGFDMPGGTFTHDGGGCSFETLIAKTGTPDAALRRIAEIVHAIDLKDGKYDRPETAGVGQLLAGIVAAHADDATRLERGATLFDDLYRAFQDKPRVTMPKGLRVPRRPT